MDDGRELRIEELLERRQQGGVWQRLVLGGFFLIMLALVGALSVQTLMSLDRLKALSEDVAASGRETLEARVAQARTQIQAAERARALEADFADFQAFAGQTMEKTGGLSDAKILARKAIAHAFAGDRLDLGSRAALSAAIKPNAKILAGAELELAKAAITVEAMQGEDYIFGGRSRPLTQVIEKTRDAAATETSLLTLASAGSAEAHAGLARFYYLIAADQTFRPDACKEALEHMTAPETLSASMALARGECLIGVGNPASAVTAFEGSAAKFRDAEPKSNADIEKAIRAFQGLGLARIAAAKEGAPGFNQSMQESMADLKRAIAFRELLGQARVERTPSMELVGFALLRQGKFQDALSNTDEVARARPMPGNLIVRALAAEKLTTKEAAALAERARKQLTYFRRRQIDECTLKHLLGPVYAGQLQGILDASIEPKQARICAQS